VSQHIGSRVGEHQSAQHDTFVCRCRRLTLIDAGHWLGVLAIIGAVLGWFGR
jgi:hypothetical protein